jgi:hypothetical protein
MAASRAGFLKKSILWFVLVKIPPALAVVVAASIRQASMDLIVFIS